MMFDSVNFDYLLNNVFIYLKILGTFKLMIHGFQAGTQQSQSNLILGALPPWLMEAKLRYQRNNGVGTMLTGSSVNGVSVPVQFGSQANFTQITGMAFKGSQAAYIDLTNHVVNFLVSGCFFCIS